MKCGWCERPIPPGARRDSKYCRVECRQAAHRAKVGRAAAARDGSSLRLAYADPPYPGKARIYEGHPDYAGEVDHPELLRRLDTYDGWALSTSAEALPQLMIWSAMWVTRDVRVAAWYRGPWPHGQARIVNAWEPVIYVPARTGARSRGTTATTDILVGKIPRTRPTLPTSVRGMKTPEFCAWVFGLIAAQPGDTFDDLFPGSGIVGRSWRIWSGDGDDAGRPLPPGLGLVV